MKKSYYRVLKKNNAVEKAAPASVWGKGCAGKGGKSTNFEIPDWMYDREMYDRKLKEMKENGGICNA